MILLSFDYLTHSEWSDTTTPLKSRGNWLLLSDGYVFVLFLKITIMKNTHCKTAREIICYIYVYLYIMIFNAALNRCIWAVVIAMYWFTSRCKKLKLVNTHLQNKFREKPCTFLDALIFRVELSATEHHGRGAASGFSSLHHILFIYRCVFTETIINPGVNYLKITSFLLLFQPKVGAFEKTVSYLPDAKGGDSVSIFNNLRYAKVKYKVFKTLCLCMCVKSRLIS